MTRAEQPETVPDGGLADAWLDSNRRTMQEALARVRDRLQGHAAGAGSPLPGATRPPIVAIPDDSGLGLLRAIFGLTPFETDILLLCAGVELDGSLPSLCAAAAGDPFRVEPTFGLALAVLPGGHWSALTPDGPLRRWRLVTLGAAAAPGVFLTRAPLRVDERILHFLVGLEVPDPLLAGRIERRPNVTEPLPATHEALAERVAALWSGSQGSAPFLQIYGTDTDACVGVAARAAALGWSTLRVIHADSLPTEPADREALSVVIERDGMLGGGPVVLDAGTEAEESGAGPLSRWARGLAGPTAVVARTRWSVPGGIGIEVEPLTTDEQATAWRSVLAPLPGDGGVGGRTQVDALVGQFQLGLGAIRTAAAEARASDASVWETARAHARPRLERLAQRIRTEATWEDLVLPAKEHQQLREIVVHVRNRRRVYEDWRFGTRSSLRGTGVSALFVGASGTGKTLAAEVLAAEMELDLFRIDLSQVVNKYIGETEKNLGEIFDAADEGGSCLLFDEADAMFGRRSEVRDSHDRYANVEVSYLLQRMEAYRGLAVLTTNMKENLDPAFLRRLQFVVTFPFPDAAERESIWRRALSPGVPTEALRFDLLARLAVPGGVIRNIALGATFLAAERNEPVTMSDLLHAARRECVKLERPLSASEIEGWV